MWFFGVPLARWFSRLGWKLRVIREAPVPSGAIVVAGNHLSHLDGPILGVAIGRPVRFMAVDGLWGVHWWLNAFLYLVGPIPVSRTRPPLGAMRTAVRHLQSGGAIGVFPEGGVVASWRSVEPHPAAASLSLRTGAPLIPVAIAGTDEAYGKDSSRLRRSRVVAVVGSPINPGDFGDADDPPAAMMSAWIAWIDGVLESGVAE